MRIQVLFFAAYREIVGSRAVSWSAREGLTLEELVDHVLAKYPGLAGHRGSMLLAVNHAVVDPDRILKEGDEVALLPPVSGGAP